MHLVAQIVISVRCISELGTHFLVHLLWALSQVGLLRLVAVVGAWSRHLCHPNVVLDVVESWSGRIESWLCGEISLHGIAMVLSRSDRGLSSLIWVGLAIVQPGV